ncbi:hypothetical protein [Streptosporangium canum]|uniref:hypothetical protein n=1 Tax=Streptosporangium canum TaxID=324952 RepID=UPI0033B9DA5A
MAYMAASSTEDIYISWGSEATGLPVQIAIIPLTSPENEPTDADYHDATRDGTDARLLIGAGTDVVLTPGQYVVWGRLTAGTRRPVRRSGLLTIGTP